MSADYTEILGRIEHIGGEPWLTPLFAEEIGTLPAVISVSMPVAGSVVRALIGDGYSRVIEILARGGSARARLYDICARHRLDPVFPRAVQQEAERLCRQPGIQDPALTDLTHLPFCTIDNRSSRDLDQALYIEAVPDGHIVYYALADVAWFVRPGTALFEEALRRGASYYLPGLMVPMLPRALSEGLVSLNPGVDRRAMVFKMQLDGAGRCRHTTILRARINSRAKLSYCLVQKFYERAGRPGIRDEHLTRSLCCLRTVGEQRLQDAHERDVVRYRRVETGISADADGQRFVAVSEPRNAAERYNEQISLLCNIEGANYLLAGTDAADTQPIYRVHPAPEDAAYAGFESLTAALARSRGLDPFIWCYRRDGGRSLADYLAGLPDEGASGRIARAIHRQALMLNVRSGFSKDAAGHHGVGAPVYARFSAPMREIVGVFLHKEVWECQRDHGSAHAGDEALRDRVVAQSNRAREMQRIIANEANRMVLDQLFSDAQHGARNALPGTVMGLDRRKVHVQLESPPIDIKIYIEHVVAQQGMSVEAEHDVQLRRGDGEVLCRLGDAVTVSVIGRDHIADRWVLSLMRR